MDIGPQSLGAEDGGLDWAAASPANETVKRDNKVTQARAIEGQLESFMISPCSDKLFGSQYKAKKDQEATVNQLVNRSTSKVWEPVLIRLCAQNKTGIIG